MKCFNALIISLFLFSTSYICAQTPGFNYQAVILNNAQIQIPGTDVKENQVPLGLENVVLQFTIKNEKGIEYIEEHQVTTDENGMISLIVGEGTSINSNFSDIFWDGKLKYLSVEINIPKSNKDFVLLDTQKILYIPHPIQGRTDVGQDNGKNIIVSNGLNENGGLIELGGPVTKATEITTTSTNTLAIKGLETDVLNDQNQIVVVDASTGVLKKVAANSLIKEEVILNVATNGKKRFDVPLPITNPKKINVYRNGVRIDFTTINSTTIELEPEAICYEKDEIRIVQFY